MEKIFAAGILIYRGEPIHEFLLMEHVDRWDLPKGHCDEGEDNLTCALRELQEETGISPGDVELVPDFAWELQYEVRPKRLQGKVGEKIVTYFLARLVRPVEIKVTEHLGYRWQKWQPPHRIQEQTIDGLLAAVELYFEGTG